MDDIDELKIQVKELNQKRRATDHYQRTMKRKLHSVTGNYPNWKILTLTTKTGRAECPVDFVQASKGLTLGKDSVTVTLQNDTEITIP